MRRGITVTVERPPGKDEYGDPLDEETSTHDIANCGVAPRLSTEIEGDPGRAGVVVGLSLYAPAGADLLRSDIVIIADGDPNAGRYEVDGEPGSWKSPLTGRNAGIEVALRRAEG